MSFKWPPKDPDEVLDYSVDWSRFIGIASLVSVSWYVDNTDGVKTLINSGDIIDGIQNVAQTVAGKVAILNLGLGTLNKEYKFYCVISDSTGSIAERVIRLRIKEQ